MDSNIFDLLLMIITLVIAVMGTYLTNFINQKIGSDKTKHSFEMAKQVIMYIEQFNPKLSNIDKKNLAMLKLIELTNGKITPEQADMLIEAAVYEVKKLIKEFN